MRYGKFMSEDKFIPLPEDHGRKPADKWSRNLKVKDDYRGRESRMGGFIIQGGKPLAGEVKIHGSKNAATKLIVASLLTDEPCVIGNAPLSADMEITAELCEKIGSRVSIDRDEHKVKIHTPEILHPIVPELSRKNRIPILALGPLLHRMGYAEVPVLGGCPIGHRPINFHVEALTKMGIAIERRAQSYFARTSEIHGAEIEFPFPSVGATENVILAAARARGRTVIKNAAVEPEIFNLVQMLRWMGAGILWKPDERVVEIEGVNKLHGVSVRVIPDRNEAVSFAVAALATGGEVFVRGARAEHLKSFLAKVDETGGVYIIEDHGIRFKGGDRYRPISIETSPHPGFMTDWQQPFCVLLTRASETSIIHETVYEDRFGYVKDLIRMGARITTSDKCPGRLICRLAGAQAKHCISIEGPSQLQGTDIAMTDIRAGMAHIIAALSARGESVITGIEHIDRGYEKVEERLQELGADIRRI